MMKKQILLILVSLIALAGAAKDLKTLRVTTEPPMTCSNCENKIKKNIRFEKGVQQITTDLQGQVVTIVYDADKTDGDKIVKAFDKMKYKATVLEDGAASPAKAEDCCKSKENDCCKAKEGGCCKAKETKACKGKEASCCKTKAGK